MASWAGKSAAGCGWLVVESWQPSDGGGLRAPFASGLARTSFNQIALLVLILLDGLRGQMESIEQSEIIHTTFGVLTKD